MKFMGFMDISGFIKADYNAIKVEPVEIYQEFDPEEWENQDLILYDGHGSPGWSGIDSDEIPLLSNSIVVSDSCLTCSTYDAKSFCNRVIRQGALAYTGAVAVANEGNVIYMNTINGIYHEGLNLGQTFTRAYDNERNIKEFDHMTILLGDPTLDIDPSLLEEPFEY